MKRLILSTACPLLLLLASCADEPAAGSAPLVAPVSTVDSNLVHTDSSTPTPPAAQTVVLRDTLHVPPPVPATAGPAPAVAGVGARFEDVLAELLPAPQSFSIRTDRDTVLRGAQGTLLRLPAGAFVDAAGKPVTGTITIELEEFYSSADILAAGLHTQSGNRLLETGGMIYWTARSGAAEVQVARGAAASVGFPVKEKRDGMQLFAGMERNGRLDWIASEGGNAVIAPAYVPARYPGGSGALARVFQQFIDPTEVIMPGERRRYTVYLRVDESGYGSVLRIRPDASAGLRQSVASALRGAARWTPAQRMGLPVSDTCQHYLDFEWTVELPKRPVDTVASARPSVSATGAPVPASAPPKEADDLSVQETMQNMQYYMMSNLVTGWVNCDRFLNDPRPRVEFVLQTNPQKEDVRVLLSSFRTFLSGSSDARGQWHFPGIPSGERLTVVAIRKEGKQVDVAFADMRAGDPVPPLVYKAMTVGDIRRRIQRISER